MARRRVALWLASLGLGSLFACGELEAVQEAATSELALSVVDRLSAGPGSVPHRGVRRFVAYAPGGSAPFEYREEYYEGAEGCFRIETLDTPPGVDAEWFRIGQSARQAFYRRYRDFRIRDVESFLDNYTLRELGTEAVVAGRECVRFAVAPQRDDGSRRYELAVDKELGIVLSYEERLLDGTPVSSLTYETFELLADPASVDCFESAFDEEPLDPMADLSEQVGFEAWSPTVLPDGYALWEAALSTDALGGRWLKLTYVDGVEPLFFLVREPQEQLAHNLPPGGQGDVVTVFDLAPFSVAQGTRRSREVIAVGKVEARELLILIDSATR